MVSINLKAGEALVYDHRLLHASKENNSSADRLVIVLGIIPQKAEMRYYYQVDNKIMEYACSPSFFMNENPGLGPTGLKAIRTIDYEFPLVSFPPRNANVIVEKKTAWQKFIQVFQ